ncbi:hypothetical protein GJ744_009674 [Endocarpon pusillum]|uniref:Uncharacterized protein n=1 Tax=Endocarpon pusillum TaxID=364733 RepID=A0A8H7E3K5_9EURO|nr:hypothetical protein GJ744_009674 [Endocarpon pusillum]
MYSSKVFIDVLSPVNLDSFRRQESTNVADIRSDLRVQASAHTTPVEHTPNPPIFVERILLSYVVLIQYPFQERHDIFFGAMLERG